MAQSNKTSSTPRGNKVGSGAAGSGAAGSGVRSRPAEAGGKRLSEKFAEINNEGRKFSTDDNPSDDRRSGSFTEGWNRPTQGARSTGYRSFDEDDRDEQIYGRQSGSNVTRESRDLVRGFSNYEESDFREDSRSSGYIQKPRGIEEENERQREDERKFSPGERDIISRRDEQRPSRSKREHYGDQSYGSYDSGAFGSRSAANRGEKQEPRDRDDRNSRGGRDLNYGEEHFGSSGRGQGYDIHQEDDDFRLNSRRSGRQDFINDEDHDEDDRGDRESSRNSSRNEQPDERPDERHYEDQPRSKEKRNGFK